MNPVYIVLMLFSLAACSDKYANADELVLTEIMPGPPYSFPMGPSSGAGRWVVLNGNFTTNYGEAYFPATSIPAIFVGHPNAYETMQWSYDTTHVLLGKNVLKGYHFDSDPTYPLTFKLVKDKGYVYLCGRGFVITKDKKKYRLGSQDTVDRWLPMLKSQDSLQAEGAAQALGYLSKTEADREKVIPGLIEALKDDRFGVHWNATEVLGRIGDRRALDALSTLGTEKSGFGDLVIESSMLIKLRMATNQLTTGNKATFTALEEGLKNEKFFLVRLEAVRAMGKCGPQAAKPLIAAIETNGFDVRIEVARSLVSIGVV